MHMMEFQKLDCFVFENFCSCSKLKQFVSTAISSNTMYIGNLQSVLQKLGKNVTEAMSKDFTSSYVIIYSQNNQALTSVETRLDDLDNCSLAQ